MGLLRKLLHKEPRYCLHLKVEDFALLPQVVVTIDAAQVWPFSAGIPDTTGSDPETAFFKLSGLKPGQDIRVTVAGEPRPFAIPEGDGHLLFIEVAADGSVCTFFMETRIAALEAAAAPEDRDRYPSASAGVSADDPKTCVLTASAGSWEHDQAAADYRLVSGGFCYRPGETLWARLQQDRRTELLRWLDPANDEAEPKALLRLFAAMVEQGLNLWEHQKIQIFLEGRRSRGGPSTQTREALGALVETVRLPVALFWQQRNGEYARLDVTPL